MKVVVVTCAHRGDDARIAHRQIRALLDAGHEVSYVAPAPTPFRHDQFRHIEIPRATGRHRLSAWRAVRRNALPISADVLIAHDIELLPLLAWHSSKVRIWDMHEDFSAAVSDRDWIPSWLRSATRGAIHVVERTARSRYRLILAEHLYRRTHGDWPVVPNTTVVPDTIAPYDSSDPRAIYVGRISRSRGMEEMIALGRRLRGRVRVELIGAADPECQSELEEAHELGHVVWHGFLANDRALQRAKGALVGLCLLRDEANFRHSMPTKLIEYLALGVPVVTTPLPIAVELAEAVDGDIVAFGDVKDAANRILELLHLPEKRSSLGERGHEYVARTLNWRVDGPRFVELLEEATA